MSDEKIKVLRESLRDSVLSDTYTALITILIIGVGVVLESGAMQWAGFLLASFFIIVRSIISSSDTSMTPQELAKFTEHKDWIVVFFTGFRDFNRNEIYEFDLIEFDREEWGGDDNIHVVTWDEQNGAWCWGGGSSSDMDWRKVIGNIYENPELLGSDHE